MSNNSVRLIVGLGNAGAAYARTWHNLGFLALDALHEAEHFRYADWQVDGRGHALTAVSTLPGSRLLLAKPQAMMNNSGEAVGSLMRWYHLRPQDLWLVHDELDLPLGKLRISRNATAAGHRGVQSVFDAVGTNAITRFRLGTNTPERATVAADAYVLQPIPETAAAALSEAIDRIVQAISLAQLAGVPEAMNQYN